MFLTSLYDEKLLQYNGAISNWTWNDAVVEAKLATENVAALLVSKLDRLGESQKSILKIAACLGGRFDKCQTFGIHNPKKDGGQCLLCVSTRVIEYFSSFLEELKLTSSFPIQSYQSNVPNITL